MLRGTGCPAGEGMRPIHCKVLTRLTLVAYIDAHVDEVDRTCSSANARQPTRQSFANFQNRLHLTQPLFIGSIAPATRHLSSRFPDRALQGHKAKMVFNRRNPPSSA